MNHPSMSDAPELITVSPDTLADYRGISCFMNPEQEGAKIRIDWIRERFSEGLTIRILIVPDTRKTVGYIEYIPGEYAWRAVDADGCLFIHCIWVYPKMMREHGYGSLLVQACIDDARQAGMTGAAVITSEGPFMAGKDLFLDCGFSLVEEEEPSYSLLFHPLKEAPRPRFRDWRSRLADFQGLHIIYANQCPWVARSIRELSGIASDHGLDLQLTELKTAREAQNAPSVYGIFSLVYNGRLLADHYLSATRFRNILRKEGLIAERKQERK